MTATPPQDREHLATELASAWSPSLPLVEPRRLSVTLHSYEFMDVLGSNTAARLTEFIRVCEQIVTSAMAEQGYGADAQLCAMLLGLGEYRDWPRGKRYRAAGEFAKTMPRAEERNTSITDYQYYLSYVRKVDGLDAMRRLLVFVEKFGAESRELKAKRMLIEQIMKMSSEDFKRHEAEEHYPPLQRGNHRKRRRRKKYRGT